MQTATSTRDVLDALARFRASDILMHERIRRTSSLTENELRILQLLVRRERDGQTVKPSEIAKFLGVSSASTTALLDRLERQGSVERRSHPTDRRSILIAPTARAESEVATLIDAYAGGVEESIERLDDAGRAAVLRFLESVSAAADAIAAD